MSSPTDLRSSLRTYVRLLAYLKDHRFRVFLTLLCMVLSAASTAFVMYQLKPIMEGTFLKTDDPGRIYDRLLRVILPLTFLSSILRALTTYGHSYFSGYLAQQAIQRLRNDLYTHILSLPMAYFNVQRTGGLASRISNDVQRLQDSIVNLVARSFSSSFNVVALVGLMLYLDWRLALAALVVIPLVLGPIFRFGRKIRQASGEGQAILADLNSQVHETLSGIRVVKAFGMEPYEKDKFRASNRKYFETAMRSIRAFAISSPLVEFVTTTAILILMVWLSQRALFTKEVTVGVFTAFFGATATLYPYLKHFNGIWGGLQSAVAAAERCFEVLDTKDPMLDAREAVAASPLRKAIEFQKVCFEYVPGHPVLRDISLTLAKGEVVALVGPSGGGKTTLAELIPRFYQPTAGRVLWDGKDVSRLKLSTLRSQVGLVTQETILFHDSIQRNIGYGRPGASFWEVKKAAEAAFAHEFIENTPQGYNTLIGERGVKLSGGQRQRLAIARALLKNPPVLILDEATSALDTESERLVQKALDSLMGYRTTLVIAHRLSTVQKADRILVVEKGRIVEQGRHSVLLARKGLYARLYRMQFREPDPKGR